MLYFPNPDHLLCCLKVIIRQLQQKDMGKFWFPILLAMKLNYVPIYR